MNKGDEISYFKIGTFVLVGLGLIIFALLIFGSSKLFQRIVYVETYFEESVQGISEGTPVQYRGLQIGYVKYIAFTNEIYKNGEAQDTKMYNRSIYVKIAITSELFTRLSHEKFNELLTEEVNEGLRVRLVPQGLTGINHLELDYTDNPKAKAATMVTWQPRYFYIPAEVSTLTQLSENAQYVMNELKDVNFKKLFKDFNLLTTTLTQTVREVVGSLNQINDPMIAALQNLLVISNNLRILSDQLKINPSSMIFGKPPPPLNPSKL